MQNVSFGDTVCAVCASGMLDGTIENRAICIVITGNTIAVIIGWTGTARSNVITGRRAYSGID